MKLLNNTALYPAPQFSTASRRRTTTTRVPASSTPTRATSSSTGARRKRTTCSVRYSHGRQDNPGLNTFPLFYNSFNTSPFQNGVINWTRTFSPTLVNEARAGVNNVMLDNGGADKGLGNIASRSASPMPVPDFWPRRGTNGGGAFNYIASLGSANIGVQQLFANTTFHYADNLTVIRGRHMMKMGGQLLREWINVFYSGNDGRSGYINFKAASRLRTPPARPAPRSVRPTSCSVFQAISAAVYRPAPGASAPTSIGTYFQDDWRVTNNLTLNLGLRWEYHSPWVEVENRQSNFNEYTGQLYLAGQSCPYNNCRALYNSYKKDFQPRIGFAYTPGILRQQAGISRRLHHLLISGGNRYQPSPAVESAVRAGVCSALQHAGQLPARHDPRSRPFRFECQQSVCRRHHPVCGIPMFVPPKSSSGTCPPSTNSPANNVLTVGYVGQHGTHLMVAMPYKQNMVVNGVVVQGPYLSGNPTLRNEISQISGTASVGNQRYDALQSTLHKRFSSGLEYSVAFTYSHGMSDSIGYYGQGGQAGSQSAYWQYLYCQRCEWGPTYFDEKFNLTGSFVYELPFGRSRKFGTNWNRAVDGFIGGWQIGGIPSWHTGLPLTIKYNSDSSGTGQRSFRVNVVGTPVDPHQIGPGVQWLGGPTGFYAAPTKGTYGNIGVGTERGPGMERFDLSLSKKFNITEHKYFELRGEAFNLTNTPIFLSPASQTITSTLFGQIRSSEGERNLQVVAKFYF